MAEAATAAPESGTDDPTPAAPDEGTALAELPDTRGSSILVPARYGFDGKQVQAIRNTVARECNEAELVMFLEVAARYGLDPFAKQIFAAKIDNRISIIVSRDGLLAHAMKQPDFLGISGDVVRENDDFGVSYVEGHRSISHSYKAKERGNILGAWAEVQREGKPPTFFYARLDEYERSGKTPWAKQKSAMILKVAEVYALRKAYSVSGVVGEEEVTRPQGREPEGITGVPDLNFGDGETGARLQSLYEEANTIEPGSYRPAKVNAILAGDPEGLQDRRERLANELADFVAERAEPIVDAEVVADDEPEAVPTEG